MQEILQKYTARQLRLAFLTQLWNSKVDFSESLMTGEVRGIEITFNVRVPILADFLRVPPPSRFCCASRGIVPPLLPYLTAHMSAFAHTCPRLRTAFSVRC